MKRNAAEAMKSIMQWLRKVLGEYWLWLLTPIWLWLLSKAIRIASTISPEGASGWWQVAIELFAFPTLLYTLIHLYKRISREHWKPEITLGAVPRDFPPSRIRMMSSLPKYLEVGPSNDTPMFRMVIRNQGKLVARSAKIEIELERASGEGNRLILDSPHFEYDSSWKTYSCHSIAGQELMIRAGDHESFAFSVFPLGAQMPYLPTSDLSIAFVTRVWADGLDPSPHEETTRIFLKASAIR